MSTFELLADECRPQPDCPKVVRVAPGELVVVGAATTVPNRVGITTALFRAAADRLVGGGGAPDPGPARPVLVAGEPVTDPADHVVFGVGRGEAAVRIGEAAFLALSSEVAA